MSSIRQITNWKGLAKIWSETVEIPTYEPGPPNRNPMFFEKRVYQGSSGRVYPYPFIESISREKKMRKWRAVFLENEYIRVMVLPELGGRIQMALDKTNDYHFVYYNRVIKPALVGLAGPWVSGGIEFNWPQHHRPSTFHPLAYEIETAADGSVSVVMGEIERMSRLRGVTRITLRPAVACIEIAGISCNKTDFPQTMLWWANPAVAVNDDYQSVFPPDVRAVMDHGKRDVSRFPVAVGTYYNQDYSAGVDISWWKNVPVPTSYMVARSRYDFCGGYDHGKQAGILHVADHHQAPGKKQWTWGTNEFGVRWHDHLTDEDGPYIELMTGVYTDNQPDFAWLHPGETKVFTQYFYPCREIGVTRNANARAALSLDVREGVITFGAYANRRLEDVVLTLSGNGGDVLFTKALQLAPDKPYRHTLGVDDVNPKEIHLELQDASGGLILCVEPETEEYPIPEAARAIPLPVDIKTVEELYLAGIHLEQYRHATREPEPYYQEGLRRDPGDIRCNSAMGLLLLRRGLFLEAETHFRTALKRLYKQNTNPSDGEVCHNLGLALAYQGRRVEAEEHFAKAAWSEAWQAPACFALGCLHLRQGNAEKALEMAARSLDHNHRHLCARHLKAVSLRKLGRKDAAVKWLSECQTIFPLEEWYVAELVFLELEPEQRIRKLLSARGEEGIEFAIDYWKMGAKTEAICLLSAVSDLYTNPLSNYLLAAIGERPDAFHRAESAPHGTFFAHRLEEAIALQICVEKYANPAGALYQLGNFYYNNKRYEDAIACWEKSIGMRPDFPTTHRNLALAYHNKHRDPVRALASLQKAFEIDTSDARVLFEFDQLRKKMNLSAAERLSLLEQHPVLVEQRDDLCIEHITLLNLLQRHEEALNLLSTRSFQPWEGGEGKVTAQYLTAHTQIAKAALREGNHQKAITHLQHARIRPHHLGEGKLHGTPENNLDYLHGVALGQKGEKDGAREFWNRACQGRETFAMSMFYYDMPPDMVFYQGLAFAALGDSVNARRRFNRLIDYGRRHLEDSCDIDYFAISLPDFIVFDDDLNKRQRAHCLYMWGLGELGHRQRDSATKLLNEVLAIDPFHQNALFHLKGVAYPA